MIYFNLLQAKLAARRARRQEEARRQSEKSAGQRILEEQSQAIAANRPVDADHVLVPEVIIPRETEEEVVGISGFRNVFITIESSLLCENSQAKSQSRFFLEKEKEDLSCRALFQFHRVFVTTAALVVVIISSLRQRARLCGFHRPAMRACSYCCAL